MGINHLPILLILAVVALIVFGPKRLPELGHGLGKAITEFRKGTAELMSSHEASVPEAPAVAPILIAPPVGSAVEVHPAPAAVAEPAARP